MFKSLFTNDSLRVVTKAKKTETRGRKTLSKRQKVLKLYFIRSVACARASAQVMCTVNAAA